MPRFKLTVEYDGTGLAGWQRQKDCPSVQAYLEQAAAKLCGFAQVIVCAGRTDAGVHAIGQVVHIDGPATLTPFNVMQGMNYHLLPLTSQIAVSKAEIVPDDFHARFSAKGRYYFYRIVNRPARLALWSQRAWHIPEKLEVNKMQKGAELLMGTHDFTTFRSVQCQAKSPIKTLDMLTVVAAGDEIHIHAQSRSFLHHQVRNMVGTLRLLGNGKWDLHQLEAALAAKDRTKGGETGQPQGLYFMEVFY